MSSSSKRRASFVDFIRGKREPMLSDEPFSVYAEKIRFVSLDVLKKKNEFIRCPDDINLTVTMKSIKRPSSVIIFVSHKWLRGSPDSSGYDGLPHPGY